MNTASALPDGWPYAGAREDELPRPSTSRWLSRALYVVALGAAVFVLLYWGGIL